VKTFEVQFTARNIGAIGLAQSRTVLVEADSTESAIRKLYDKYEHITFVRTKEVTK
jgi:hypothetical protein